MPKAPAKQDSRPAWTPRDDKEAAARDQGLPYVGIDGNAYQDEPQPVAAPAEPVEDTTPPSAPPAEVKHAIEGSPHNPSHDSDLVDSLGNAKTEEAELDEKGQVVKVTTVEKAGTAGQVGPRGKGAPPESLSAEEKAKRQRAEEERLAKGMSSTARVDSIGNLKGAFEDPKKRSEDTRVEDQHHMVGPRGKGAPADSYHGPRPAKKS